jgi:hypothetical protein
MATTHPATPDETVAVKPLQALIIVPIVLGLVVLYIVLNGVFGSAEYFVGYLFALYWAAIQHADLKALPASVSGAVLGLVLSLTLHMLTGRLGMLNGSLWFAALVVPVLFFQMVGMFKFCINNATMLFLTAGTISHVQASADFKNMFISLGLGVVYVGGLAWLITTTAALLQARRAARPSTGPGATRQAPPSAL